MPLNQEDQGDYVYLTDFRAKDKSWDTHRAKADQVRDLYRGTTHFRLFERIEQCSRLLVFGAQDTEEGAKLRLKRASFCRVRHCPVCQWRRSIMWVARFLKAIPALNYDYPKARYIFLTLTVENCQVSELRATVKQMNLAWKRLSLRKEFPAIGFAKSLEVTRSEKGEAHPHFHVLMMVNPSYFDGKNYLSQERWTELWRDCMRLSYTPIVHVQAIKPKKNKPESSALESAVCEVFKYSVKPQDLVADQEWLLEVTDQLHKTRAVAIGGEFKNYLVEDEPEDLIGESEKIDELLESSITFGWREMRKRYVKVSRS